jgi:uncharacterized protein YbjT (DUF2867 family)
MPKTYVVAGTTSQVGRVVVARLKAQGHQIRPVSRSAGVSFDNAAALTRSFAGADGAFLMIPFDIMVLDLHKRENEIGMKLAGAGKTAGVRHVVPLSGTSAYLEEGAGNGSSVAINSC